MGFYQASQGRCQAWSTSFIYGCNDRRCSKIKCILIQELLKFLTGRPSAFIDEMVWFVWDACNVLVSQSSIKRILKQERWSLKLVSSFCFHFHTNRGAFRCINAPFNAILSFVETGLSAFQDIKLISSCSLTNPPPMSILRTVSMDGRQSDPKQSKKNLSNVLNVGQSFQHIHWMDILTGKLSKVHTPPICSTGLSNTSSSRIAILSLGRIQLLSLIMQRYTRRRLDILQFC
jgi:hypothetical protein